ncbi:MAG: sugar transferase, partial [Candidatus Aminicenantes bacterium]|nr:sugar transferase [Candidatus Aminicenantes bacterium]
MKTRSRKKGRILVYGGEILLLILSFVAAYWLRFVSFEKFGRRLPLGVFLIMIVVYPAAFYFAGLYLRPGRPWSSELYWRLAFAVGPAAIALGFLKYAIFLEPIGRGLLFIASFLFFLAVFVWRSLVGPWWARGESAPKRIHFVGSEAEKRALEAAVGSGAGAKGDEYGFETGELEAGAELIVVGEREPVDKEMWRRIHQAQRGGAEVAGFNEMYQSVSGRIPVDFIAGEDWFWRTAGFQLSESGTFVRVKRAVDFGLAIVFVVVTFPFWGLIALLIKATSRGKVFYRQERVGKNGTVFKLMKFRSMIERAEDSEPVWAKEKDERVTKVGRILRRVHADELPQLLNVLKGEMSLVGPRPERPGFVEMLEREIPFYGLRHLVKPGLTGWAQINHPYAASLEDSKVKLEYDLYYIAHMGLGFDLRILLRTVQAPTPNKYGDTYHICPQK